MKSITFKRKKQILFDLLVNLCRQYGVNVPELIIERFDYKFNRKLYGYYSDFYDGSIHLNSKKVGENLIEATRTLRHEFFHHLQYQLDLCDRWTKTGKESAIRLEVLARRFEKNQRIPQIIPKTQQILTQTTQKSEEKLFGRTEK